MRYYVEFFEAFLATGIFGAFKNGRLSIIGDRLREMAFLIICRGVERGAIIDGRWLSPKQAHDIAENERLSGREKTAASAALIALAVNLLC